MFHIEPEVCGFEPQCLRARCPHLLTVIETVKDKRCCLMTKSPNPKTRSSILPERRIPYARAVNIPTLKALQHSPHNSASRLMRARERDRNLGKERWSEPSPTHGNHGRPGHVTGGLQMVNLREQRDSITAGHLAGHPEKVGKK